MIPAARPPTFDDTQDHGERARRKAADDQLTVMKAALRAPVPLSAAQLVSGASVQHIAAVRKAAAGAEAMRKRKLRQRELTANIAKRAAALGLKLPQWVQK